MSDIILFFIYIFILPLLPSLLHKITCRLVHKAQIQSKKRECKWGWKMVGVFWGYKNLICFFSLQGWEPKYHHCAHTPPCEHLSICQIRSPIVPLACSTDTQRHSYPLKNTKHYPCSSGEWFAPTTPCLPNHIKLINSFLLHQFYSISFSCYSYPRPIFNHV